ncbi:hypothetical protein LPJ53_001978 [Coemansia erecta]|uniref:Extracellular membrane protein CFEM domain-containing protein n=1 Tax=Coemansia erecta TaxID=147472 RepID=A0A9W7Y355_9FUNG|nr:hypothetical protein LPJ53_001978 [Coemansia erecta]
MRRKLSYIMLLSAAALLLLASSVQASKQCNAQHILDACLVMQQKHYKSCAYDDWECKCHSQKKILVCYDNCPDSENRTLQEMQVQIFCAAVNGKEYNSELIDRMTRPARIVADDPQPTRVEPEQQQQQQPPPPPRAPADADRDDDGVFGGRASGRKGAGGGHGSNFSLVDDNSAGAIDSVTGARSAMAAALIAAYIIGSAI